MSDIIVFYIICAGKFYDNINIISFFVFEFLF